MIKTYLGSVQYIYISSLITFFIAGVQLILSSYYEIYFLMIVFSIISLGYFVFLILLSVDLNKKDTTNMLVRATKVNDNIITVEKPNRKQRKIRIVKSDLGKFTEQQELIVVLTKRTGLIVDIKLEP